MVNKPSPEEILKLILGEFGDRDITVNISHDDGGHVVEIWTLGVESSKEVRKLIPAYYEGWRTVVLENQLSPVK
jgi:hypothetical protein